jgi:hypothetical protein
MKTKNRYNGGKTPKPKHLDEILSDGLDYLDTSSDCLDHLDEISCVFDKLDNIDTWIDKITG